ncbi:MAG: AgmX/PglI C-terminal domain-containing protein [Kofleriaceae bacterium]|nr:MAG: AgmX/PglI C-terminal domain-containing protein [Kofleriaceae bacterium]MBZ0231604.1 AgmX/PglI C-terminal domain-containing protein [Kofleriaceae bacterium]
MTSRTITAAVAVVALAACSRTGMGSGVREDINARMQTIQAPVQMCYAVALERDRKLRGMMVLSFRAAPGTGQFDQITVTRDEVGDEQVKKCVVDEVAKLKLTAPQKTAVTVSYPIDFAPKN